MQFKYKITYPLQTCASRTIKQSIHPQVLEHPWQPTHRKKKKTFARRMDFESRDYSFQHKNFCMAIFDHKTNTNAVSLVVCGCFSPVPETENHLQNV
jgi:hypothetical protein